MEEIRKKHVTQPMLPELMDFYFFLLEFLVMTIRI